MNKTPFYLDWQFWSFAVAAIAIILSQLPPLKMLIRRGRIKCEAFSKMLVTHRLGNANITWHLIIENSGGREIRIREVNLIFKRNGAIAFNLPAQSYFKTPEETDSIMFTPFRLKGGEDWAHFTSFYRPIERNEEKEFRYIESAIRTDIQNKRAAAASNTLCEASVELTERAKKFSERHFAWNPGEWEIELKIKGDNDIGLSRKYRFSLFETESKELEDYSEVYKYGFGVSFPSPFAAGITIPVHEV